MSEQTKVGEFREPPCDAMVGNTLVREMESRTPYYLHDLLIKLDRVCFFCGAKEFKG